MSEIILFGAGSIGRNTIRHLRSRGVEPVGFADNDQSKWGRSVDGCVVHDPQALATIYPSATWVASATHHLFGKQLRAQIEAMGVRQKNLWECLTDFPSVDVTVRYTLNSIIDNFETIRLLEDQIHFRRTLDCDAQMPCSDIADIYFPDFITRYDAEHYLDAGSADGDTVRAFVERWPSFAQITALEPDSENFHKLSLFAAKISDSRLFIANLAVGDYDHHAHFTANGDCSSHLDMDGGETVRCQRIDDMEFERPPTYIKMDIEGAELEALWGARNLLRDHSPVLAICAYHTADHLWQIPLLIHALQPRYDLHLRRYAEGASELVWYGVPPERVS